MRELIENARETILSAGDTVCLERARLITEAYRALESEPVPILRAKAFAYVLERMTLDLATNPIFAGNTSTAPRAWMLVPEHGFAVPAQALVENPRVEGLLDGDAIPDELRDFWADRGVGGGAGVGHPCFDIPRLLAVGIDAIAEEAEQWPDDGDEPKATYRKACAIGCRAVVRWAERYADAGEAAAKECDDPARAAALTRMAKACRHVPARSARDLFDALQSIALVHLAIHVEGHGYSVSPGRLDQWLMPYFRDDPDTVELLMAFLLKLTANSVFGSHSKTQCITLGGVDAEGNDQCNAMTALILEAFDRLRVPDPHVFVRWHRNIDPAIKRRSLRMLASGVSMPMLIGDEQTAAGLIRAGVTEADAFNYIVIGCNELGVPSKLIYNTIVFNGITLLRELLCDAEARAAISTMDGLLDALGGRMHEIMRQRIEGSARHWPRRLASRAPTPFTSAVMDGCVARGTDMHERMTYELRTVSERGVTNTINALAAIEQVVFTDRAATLDQLAEALESNFASPAGLRERLLAAPKWGNDDDRADQWGVRYLDLRERVRADVERETGIPMPLICHVIRSLHYVDGRPLGATPDGRLAGEPLADSIGAQLGTAVEGPTALLNSVCKTPASRYYTGGTNLNVTLPAVEPTDEAMLARYEALVETFFSRGGQELQFNFISAATLKNAQSHPEKYPDLLVRIAGFNARFIDLAREEQNELIARAEHSDQCG